MVELMMMVIEANVWRIEITEGKEKKLGFLFRKIKERRKEKASPRMSLEPS